MVAIREDRLFGVLARCPDCVVEYGLFRSGQPYRGVQSHREALLCMMRTVSAQDGEPQPLWTFDVGEAQAFPINAQTLLALPDTQDGTGAGFDKRTDGGSIPYWAAFLQPPHGGRLTPADFCAVNDALFPRGTDSLTAYVWSTDWSDYFDDGREWWGTGCWSVYDASLDRYAVILASATD